MKCQKSTNFQLMNHGDKASEVTLLHAEKSWSSQLDDHDSNFLIEVWKQPPSWCVMSADKKFNVLVGISQLSHYILYITYMPFQEIKST